MGRDAWLARARFWWRRYWSLGQRGERAAARLLRRQGYHIVARGERSRLGELDLVAVDGRTVVFVEVKTRRSHDAGRPDEAVGPQKQQRLTRLALAFLKRHDLLHCASRFDVVGVTWPADAWRPRMVHIKNAFEATGQGQMYS